MTTNIEQFEIQIRRFEDKELPRRHSELVTQIANEVLEGVVKRTPVDTGFARNNWEVVASGQATGAPAYAGDPITRGRVALQNLRPFQDVDIVNGTDYIIPLEYGHSDQAPEGMVSVTISDIKARYEG